MPELPQMQALSERLDAALRGATLDGYEVLGFTALKTVVPAPDSLLGHELLSVGRRAKYLVFDFGEPGRILVHLSQAGRVDVEWPPKKNKGGKGGAVRLRFLVGEAQEPVAVLVREWGTERKAAWWVLAPDDDGPLERLGPEPDSDEFAELVLHGTDKRRVHTILRDQRTVSGVGRGYADDALWRAQLSPYASLASLKRRPAPAPARLRARGARRRPRARTHPQGRVVGAQARRALRGARPPRHAVPPLRRHDAPRELRELRGHVLPRLPDRRQGPRRPPHVAPAQVTDTNVCPDTRSVSTHASSGHQPRVPGSPLNGPTTVRRDPAAVEPAGLRRHELVVDEARVHRRGVERDVPGIGANAGDGVSYAHATRSARPRRHRPTS